MSRWQMQRHSAWLSRRSPDTDPERAWYLRTILLELERICSHLGDQAGMLVDVAFPLGANQFSVLREECFRRMTA